MSAPPVARPAVMSSLLAPMPGELPEADASGRIQYLAALPLEKIPAGSYELRVTVTDGTTSVMRSANFKIED